MDIDITGNFRYDFIMKKKSYEIRDPIHVFIKMDSTDREVMDSRPFQRLRYIRQLATSYLIYPGATHTRFEHSLGVMELAGRIFDTIMTPENVHPEVSRVLDNINNPDALRYWRKVLKIAALCHDMGHLPFSHAAEKDLLPQGWDHERITGELILSDEMRNIWKNAPMPLEPEHIYKLALGKKGAKNMHYTDWETILSEIITGNSFGADRIDYLLRDSHFAGVAYGKFDHYRLIDTLRILPPPETNENREELDSHFKKKNHEKYKEPMLGIEKGGIQAAEALVLARYFMFSQVYFHRVRRIYDIHLKDFLADWLSEKFPGEKKFPTNLEGHLSLTDNEVITEMRNASLKRRKQGHIHAERIIGRKHFKMIYERNPKDMKINPYAINRIYSVLCEKYGKENLRYDEYPGRKGNSHFPVLMDDGRVIDAYAISDTLKKIPASEFGYVFIEPKLRDKAEAWLKKHREEIIKIEQESL